MWYATADTSTIYNAIYKLPRRPEISNCANTASGRECTISSVLKAISPISTRHGSRDRVISAPRTDDRFLGLSADAVPHRRPSAFRPFQPLNGCLSSMFRWSYSGNGMTI